ncbi:MAG: hypothetical protein KJ042_16085 [Deltaproteobacteria bacterium]|nr:hypothetical protein [Deltaproteobacteria bacterium]
MRFQILRLKEEFLGALTGVERLVSDAGQSSPVYAESARRSLIAFGRAAALLGPGGDSTRVSRRLHAARDALRVLGMDLDMLLALGLIDKTRLAPSKREIAEIERILGNIERLGRGGGGPSGAAEPLDDHSRADPANGDNVEE